MRFHVQFAFFKNSLDQKAACHGAVKKKTYPHRERSLACVESVNNPWLLKLDTLLIIKEMLDKVPCTLLGRRKKNYTS